MLHVAIQKIKVASGTFFMDHSVYHCASSLWMVLISFLS